MMHRLCLMTRDNPVLLWGVEHKQLPADPPAVIVHTCTTIVYKIILNLYVPVTANKSFLFLFLFLNQLIIQFNEFN